MKQNKGCACCRNKRVISTKVYSEKIDKVPCPLCRSDEFDKSLIGLKKRDAKSLTSKME